jgi:hypothetical protein
MPQTTKKAHFWPLTLATYDAKKGTKAVQAIVEWRQPYPIQIGTNLHREELEKRRDLLVDLLHRASATDAFRVIDCLGHVLHQGRLDGKLSQLIGFVSAVPAWADATNPLREAPGAPVDLLC